MEKRTDGITDRRKAVYFGEVTINLSLIEQGKYKEMIRRLI